MSIISKYLQNKKEYIANFLTLSLVMLSSVPSWVAIFRNLRTSSSVSSITLGIGGRLYSDNCFGRSWSFLKYVEKLLLCLELKLRNANSQAFCS